LSQQAATPTKRDGSAAEAKMPRPLSAFLANERTYLEWVNMSLLLGAVALALFAVGEQEGAAAGQSAHVLGVVVMPVAVAFAAYSGYLFWSRKRLLQEDKLNAPEIQSTAGPVLLAAFLAASLVGVLVVELFGTAVMSRIK